MPDHFLAPRFCINEACPRSRTQAHHYGPGVCPKCGQPTVHRGTLKVRVMTSRLSVLTETWEVEIPADTPPNEYAAAAQAVFRNEEDEHLENIDTDWTEDDTPQVTTVLKERPHVQRDIDSGRVDDLRMSSATELDRLTDPALGPINRPRGGPDHDA